MSGPENRKVVPFPAPETNASPAKHSGGEQGKGAEIVPIFPGRETELERFETIPILIQFTKDKKGNGTRLTVRVHPEVAEQIIRVQIRADNEIPHPSEIRGATKGL